MKIKISRRIMTGLSALVLFIVMVLVLRNIAFASAPISNNMTVDELQQLDLRVGYIENAEGWTDDIYETFCEEQLSGSKECSNILVGVPTGNIYFNRGTILQEVRVKEIVKGNCKYETIWLQNGLQSTFVYDGTSVLMEGMDRSLMQSDCEYLLFCSPLITNKYSDKKVYTEADAMWFGCYNLTRDSEIVMEAGNNAYNPLVEFYTSSERTLECYNQTKRKLIEMYCEGK